MSEHIAARSDLVEIAKINGDFRGNYGKLLGAYLYLRSIRAAQGRPLVSTGLISVACSVLWALLAKHG